MTAVMIGRGGVSGGRFGCRSSPVGPGVRCPGAAGDARALHEADPLPPVPQPRHLPAGHVRPGMRERGTSGAAGAGRRVGGRSRDRDVGPEPAGRARQRGPGARCAVRPRGERTGRGPLATAGYRPVARRPAVRPPLGGRRSHGPVRAVPITTRTARSRARACTGAVDARSRVRRERRHRRLRRFLHRRQRRRLRCEGVTCKSSSGESSATTVSSGSTSRRTRAHMIAPSSELIISVARAVDRSGVTPVRTS